MGSALLQERLSLRTQQLDALLANSAAQRTRGQSCWSGGGSAFRNVNNRTGAARSARQACSSPHISHDQVVSLAWCNEPADSAYPYGGSVAHGGVRARGRRNRLPGAPDQPRPHSRSRRQRGTTRRVSPTHVRGCPGGGRRGVRGRAGSTAGAAGSRRALLQAWPGCRTSANSIGRTRRPAIDRAARGRWPYIRRARAAARQRTRDAAWIRRGVVRGVLAAGQDVIGVDDGVGVTLLGQEPLPVRGVLLVVGVA